MGYKYERDKWVFDGRLERPLTKSDVFGKNEETNAFDDVFGTLVDSKPMPRQKVHTEFDNIFENEGEL